MGKNHSDYVKANPRKYYPVVYSKSEISRLLAEVRGKWSIMARLQYGCGLRISELCRLRVKDVDLERGKLYIRASKGDQLSTCQKIHVGLRASPNDVIIFCLGLIRKSCRLRRRKRPFRSVPIHTFYDTATRRICWKMERIFERCSNF